MYIVHIVHVTWNIFCVKKHTIVGARAVDTLSMPALLIGWAQRAEDQAVVHGGSLKTKNMVRMVWLDFGVHELKIVEICQRCRTQSMLAVAAAGVAGDGGGGRLIFGRLYVALWQIVVVAIVSNQRFVPILIQPHLVPMYLKNPFFHPYTQFSLLSLTKLTSIAQF